MSLVKKSDVKNHLSPRFRKEIHLNQPESQPDATGFSVAEPAAVQAEPTEFARDFQGEHSSAGAFVPPPDPMNGPVVPQAPAASQTEEPVPAR
ncbi:MAG: hypothetical protein WCE75_11875 [Terracidiphilus sp.]